MKRIIASKPPPKYVANGDKERAKKRKESFKRNKRRKRTPKQRIAKPRYDERNSNTKPPYYDPHETHIHIWKYGKIPCREDGKKNISDIRE